MKPLFEIVIKDGEAMPQDGDIQSPAVRITLPAKAPVELLIGADK